eukprot:TRINITY_DN4670_c0_g1_i1.p1 TRINITY_DN4670_c0_g1~~TRINITY_DN4670_c0_g1_i1.p1  ORF type:complete len:319 (-),score=122.50 TRINITY_DN4670_c0_g1_i1:105-1061(-)
MVKESTVICIDNSEHMRNGDYSPSRMEAQAQAVNWLMNNKYGGNAENTVGILKMSGGVEALVAPCPRSGTGKLISALHEVKIGGKLDFLSSVQIAQLVLKHRRNKDQQQRMILFIGSPLEKTDTKAMVRIGKGLKKNNVAVDIVSFGEADANKEVLTAFINEVNSNNNSNIVSVPAGVMTSLKDAIRQSSIVEGGAGAAGGAAGEGAGEFGEEDQDLMAAINASIEDERRRKASEDAASGGGAPAASAGGDAMQVDSAAGGGGATAAGDVADFNDMSEEDMLQLALQMSKAAAENDESKSDENKMDVEEKKDEEKKGQ